MLLNISRIYALKAIAELDLGYSDRALADTETIIGLAKSIQDEPLLISQHVRAAIMIFDAHAVWNGLDSHRWTETQLAELQSQLERIDLLRSSRRAFQFETALIPKSFETSLITSNPFAVFVSSPVRDRTLQSECLSFFCNNLKYQNLLHLAHFDEEYVLPVMDSNQHKIDVGKIKMGGTKIEGMKPDYGNVFSMINRAFLYSILTRSFGQTFTEQSLG